MPDPGPSMKSLFGSTTSSSIRSRLPRRRHRRHRQGARPPPRSTAPLGLRHTLTRVVFLATRESRPAPILRSQVKRLHRACRRSCLRARHGLCRICAANNYELGIELVSTNDNVVMTRHLLRTMVSLPAPRLGLLPIACRRHAGPHPRCVRSRSLRPCCAARGDRRSGAYRERDRA